MRNHPNHPEAKYLEYLIVPKPDYIDKSKKTKIRRSVIEEERQFIEFLRIHKWEWRHYYEENHPGKNLVTAGRKFILLCKRIREHPNLPYADIVKTAK